MGLKLNEGPQRVNYGPSMTLGDKRPIEQMVEVGSMPEG